MSNISGFYAQLTGVLAGFALTAMAVLVTPRREPANHATMGALFAAFIALIITSLTYSVLGGDVTSEAHARAATLELIDGLPFGLAATVLFHGVTLFLTGHVDPVTLWVARAFAAVVGPTLTLFYITNGATDIATAIVANQGRCATPGPPHVGITLTAVLAVVLTISLIPGAQPRFMTSLVGRIRSASTVLVVTATVSAALVGGVVSTKPATFVLADAGVAPYLGGAFVVLLVLGLLLSLGYGADDKARRDRDLRPSVPIQGQVGATEVPAPQ